MIESLRIISANPELPAVGIIPIQIVREYNPRFAGPMAR